MKNYLESYPILEFHIHNSKLLFQISNLLKKFGVENYTRDEKRVYLYGEKRIMKFLKEIPVKNPKLISKIPKEYFNKFP